MQKLLRVVASIGWTSLMLVGLLLMVIVIIMIVRPPAR